MPIPKPRPVGQWYGSVHPMPLHIRPKLTQREGKGERERERERRGREGEEEGERAFEGYQSAPHHCQVQWKPQKGGGSEGEGEEEKAFKGPARPPHHY